MRVIMFAALLSLASISAYAADASERKFISKDMSEGVVLAKLGKPDSESVLTGDNAKVTVKEWIYLPAPNDSQTVTTITLKGGKVTDIRRDISR